MTYNADLEKTKLELRWPPGRHAQTTQFPSQDVAGGRAIFRSTAPKPQVGEGANRRMGSRRLVVPRQPDIESSSRVTSQAKLGLGDVARQSQARCSRRGSLMKVSIKARIFGDINV